MFHFSIKSIENAFKKTMIKNIKNSEGWLKNLKKQLKPE